MAGKAKFDQESAFKSIIVPGQKSLPQVPGKSEEKGKSKNRVQRSYFLDRDIDKALRKMALEEEKNLTESINEILRKGLAKYL